MKQRAVIGPDRVMVGMRDLVRLLFRRGRRFDVPFHKLRMGLPVILVNAQPARHPQKRRCAAVAAQPARPLRKQGAIGCAHSPPDPTESRVP